MADVLFVTLAAGGNLPPATGIGRELKARGHRVRVLGHETQRSAVSEAGLGFAAYRHSPPWSSTEKKGTVTGLRSIQAVLTHPGLGRDLVDLVRADPADLIVIDCMLVNVLEAASREGLPHVALFHTFYGYFDGPFRQGPVGLICRLKRLGMRRLWSQADLGLVCADRQLDPAGPDAPENVVWAGVVQETGEPARPSARPQVLASLSTTYFPGQREALQNILDAVDGMDVDLTMTTGPAVDPQGLTPPANATVCQYVPHEQLLPGCAVVIGHGGHGTAMRALGHDLPLLMMPMHPLLDQPMVGQAVAGQGAGLMLKRTASAQQIRDTLTTLIAEESYRTAAAAVGARIRANDGAQTAADLLVQRLPVLPAT
jgi:UDP:flavonoid glycosyltransferase YjiC (YdhE family)